MIGAIRGDIAGSRFEFSNTITAIAGSVAEAFYGIQDEMSKIAIGYLDTDMNKLVEEFYEYVKC